MLQSRDNQAFNNDSASEERIERSKRSLTAILGSNPAPPASETAAPSIVQAPALEQFSADELANSRTQVEAGSE